MADLYTGIDQVSNASLTLDGVYYHMVSYLNRSDRRVETVLYTRQEHGQSVELGRYAVAGVAAGQLIDCPKLLALDDMFVIHWIQAEDLSSSGPDPGGRLHRALFTLTDLEAGWDAQGSTDLYADLLYDARRIEGSDDFVVALKPTASTLSVRRYEAPYSWVDSVWISSFNETAAPHILGVYGHEGDDDVVVTWERASDNSLRSRRAAASDGTLSAIQQTFTFPSGVDDPAGDPYEGGAYFVQVSHVRTGSREIGVAVEAVPVGQVAHSTLHWVVWGTVSSATGAASDQHYTPHLNLGSHLWTWDRGGISVDGLDVYGLLTHTGAPAPGQMTYAAAWVSDFHKHLWASYEEAELRPHARANINSVGVADGRPAGHSPGITTGDLPAALYADTPVRRMNHLSEVAFPQLVGPLSKAKHVGAVTYSRLEMTRGYDDVTATDIPEAWPAGAAAVVYNFMHEDLWHPPADAAEGSPALDNFVGPYPYAMHGTVEAGRSLLIAGGTPHVYDGAQVVEVGFPWRPEILLVESYDANESGPYSDANTYYQYYAVYKWTDAQGQTHRSAPSNIYTHNHTTIDAPSESRMRVRVRCISTSLRGDWLMSQLPQPVEIEIYRTPRFVLADAIAAGEVSEYPSGGLFYRVYGSNLPTSTFRPEFVSVNRPESLYVEIDDGVHDEALVWHGVGPYQLSDGGFIPIPPQQPPALSVCAQWRRRVFMSTGEDDNTIWYSREIQLDQGADFYRAVEFNDQNTFRIEGIERITGMCSGLGEGLVVFTSDSIEYLVGEGNDATGQGASFQMRTLHKGVGCINPRSVVLTPRGVLFQSFKGLYILNSGLALEPAGLAVEDVVKEAGLLQSASLLEDRHQVRFVANRERTFTRVWTIIVGDAVAGTRTITGLTAPIAHTSVGGATTSSIALALDTLLSTDPLVVDVARAGNTLTVTLVNEHDERTLAATHSDGGAITASLASSTLEHEPLVIIWDYLSDVWALCDLPSAEDGFDTAVGGCAWRGVDGGLSHVMLHAGAVRVEKGPRDADRFVDDPDSPVLIDVTTAWMHLTGLSNASRIRRMFVETRREEAGAVEVVVEYDKDGTFDGDDPAPSTHSFSSPAPGSLPVCPRVQKASAFRVRVYEPAGAPGGAVTLLGLSLQIPPKTTGVGRRSPAQRS